jgi:hypothetical protein
MKIIEEDKKNISLKFETIDAQGKKSFLFERTHTDNPDLDDEEPLYIYAKHDNGDVCLFLTKEDAKILRDFIDEVLESTK